MLVRFLCNGTVVFKGEADCVPSPGSTVEFRMLAATAEAEAGQLVEAIVSSDTRTRYDYDTQASRVIVDMPVHKFSSRLNEYGEQYPPVFVHQPHREYVSKQDEGYGQSLTHAHLSSL